MISRANIGEDVILRPVFANQNTNQDTVDDLLAEIVKIGDEIV